MKTLLKIIFYTAIAALNVASIYFGSMLFSHQSSAAFELGVVFTVLVPLASLGYAPLFVNAWVDSIVKSKSNKGE